MKLILSVDDGCAEDVRVANLAAKYSIPLTFYWPVEMQLLAQIKGYKPLDFFCAAELLQEAELGSHGVTHNHLTKMTQHNAEVEISSSKMMLEGIYGTKITKFAPSRGYTNPELTEYTLNYYDSQRLTKGFDAEGYKLVHIHPDSGANDNRSWRELALEYDNVHLWGHSWEFSKYDQWRYLEEFLRDTPR